MVDKPKRPEDANQLAKLIVDMATGEIESAGRTYVHYACDVDAAAGSGNEIFEGGEHVIIQIPTEQPPPGFKSRDATALRVEGDSMAPRSIAANWSRLTVRTGHLPRAEYMFYVSAAA